ncbi:MAG: acetoin utilization protein AcuC [Gammaproteobacteria bacterium]|nr:acetoin utilization protein AcuC [Gammaproteobacteria bacterium]
MTAVYFGEALGRYGFGDGHPFGPDRLAAFWAETRRRGLDKQATVLEPVMCEESDLTRFHTPGYVSRVRTLSREGVGYLDTGDTPAVRGIYEAAANVVGSDLDGLRRILAGEERRVFVPIAGLHHARRDSAAGFCVFDDIGVLIETLKQEHGFERIAYVDIDAHHGDGVFYAYESDPGVTVADIHEDGRYLYPGTGAADETGTGAGEGSKLNFPMQPGCDDSAFHQAWPQLEEFVRASRPQIILLQAGADSVAGDPITHMRFTPAAHRYATERLCAVADEFCNGRIIATGGGGYNRRNLALAWNEVLEALLAS